MKLFKWSTLVVAALSLGLSTGFANTTKAKRNPAQAEIKALTKVFFETFDKAATTAEKEVLNKEVRALVGKDYPASKLEKMSDKQIREEILYKMDPIAQELFLKTLKAKLGSTAESKTFASAFTEMEKYASQTRSGGNKFADKYADKPVKSEKAPKETTPSKTSTASTEKITNPEVRKGVETANKELVANFGEPGEALAKLNTDISAEAGVEYVTKGCTSVKAASEDLLAISKKVHDAHPKNSEELAKAFNKEGAEHTGTEVKTFCEVNMQELGPGTSCNAFGPWVKNCKL